MTTPKLDLDALLRAASLDIDCGDSSCVFARNKTGQRTNGGCRCLDGRGSKPAGARVALGWAWRGLPALIEELRAARLVCEAADCKCPGRHLREHGHAEVHNADCALSAWRKAVQP